jgi:diguanylate cyclase (GGDEF)-like protein
MTISYSLTAFLGSIIIVILLIINFLIKQPGKSVQKSIFFILLIVVSLALMIDFGFSLFNPPNIRNTFWPFVTALLLFVYLFVIKNENQIDDLTGLNNRHSFFEFTGKLSHNKESRIIALIDVNNFKMINKVYGNREGDNALYTLSKIIKKYIRKTDFAARYGGDEFVVAARVENGIEKLIEGIKTELNTHNEKTEKPYNIHINYVHDIFDADGSRSVDDLLLFFEQQIKNQLDENRRAGDVA